MKKLLLVFLLSILFPIVSSAQIDREIMRSVKVHFRQGTIVLDENYMDNKTTLSEFAKEVKAYYSDSTARFRQIRVVSSASPEGGKTLNDHIAKMRAEAITDWISREIAVNLEYAVESTGIDWGLLKSLIEENSDVPYRDEVLELLERVPATKVENGKEIEVRYNELRALRAGAPYNWIYENIFPKLRYASARCEFWWETVPELFLSHSTPLRYPAEGANGIITFDRSVADNAVPKVKSADGWVDSLIPTDKNIAFVVAPNPSAEPRTTSITLTCYGKQYVVPIEQEAAKPEMHITSANEVTIPAQGASDKITFEKRFTDDVVPTTTSSADWIESIVPTAEGITYVAKENPSQDTRTATIVVKCYDQKHEITVNQLGAEPECKPLYMAIKTNMLYDVAAIPNIGVEFYLGKNFSIAGNWQYSWWKSDKKSWYWRTYGGDLSLRYWFGKRAKAKPLTGHHLGLYGQMITYDFEVGNRGILADKWSYTAGLEYGYSLPIARRFNIDFTIGAGYHWGLFDEYLPIDGHYVWQATKHNKYFGPTKLEVSLVWLIGCDNYNRNKGGKR